MKKHLFAIPLAVLSLLGIASCNKGGESDITSSNTTPTTNVPTSSTSGGTTTTTVEEKLQSIRVDYSTAKTAYVIGETLDMSGLHVYANMGTKEVELTASQYEIDSTQFDGTKRGDYYIKVIVTIDDVVKTRQFLVSVTSILENTDYIIGITAEGNKTEYQYGEALDLTGLEVKAYYKSGEEKIISSDKYTIDDSKYNSLMRGTYEIRIEYTETYTSGSASESVTVDTCVFATVILNMESISVSGTRNFYQYDEISTSDWEVTVKYEEGVSEVITTGFTTNIDEIFPDVNIAKNYTDVTVSYSYNGKTATTTISCQVIGVEKYLNAGTLPIGGPNNEQLEIDSTFTLLPGYSVLADSVTCGSQAFARCIALVGTGTRDENSIKLSTSRLAKTLFVCVSSDEGSSFGLYDSEGNPIKVYTIGSDVSRLKFDIPAQGTYYLWGDISVSVYYVGIWNR